MIFISLLSSVFACLVCFTDTGGKIFVPRFNNASFSLFFQIWFVLSSIIMYARPIKSAQHWSPN